ncbi:MAG: hypothetical protein HY730_02340 [Candidatus Tectomicrobia bacterium]|uniref:Uncharacterized protein n=1 Tax=Tectimicrobiota bacterium TaxID=2528274 RepID=A0A933GKE2_UNCTE|nr:hypothetical protein [Candidatus Tectomicrobia bacterium]
MKPFGGKINEDYGWEVALFFKLRDFSDGVIFFEMTMNWDRYLADHSPKFGIHIVVLNYTVLEANIYYLHHRDED